MKTMPSPISSLALAALALVIAGCGGGGDDGTGIGVAADSSCDAPSGSASVVVGSGTPGDPAAPEPATGFKLGKTTSYSKTYMVVTANPFASKAGCQILKAGGSAADAAVAVQAVLGLVEPQSSGVGGGAFLLHYDAKTGTVQSYDGRETAPAAATANYLRWIDDTTDKTLPKPNARASGRSIGTPGAVRMLELVQRDYGKLAWKDLFQSGIQLATDGFVISGRLFAAIEAQRTDLLRDADAKAYFLNADGTSKTLGTLLRNPAYATTLSRLAAGGADALYTGPIAQAIIDKINVTAAVDGTPITPGKTTLADLAAYKAKKRTPICTTYRVYWVCGMPPPSSGGITVAATLGVLENFYLAGSAPTAIDIYGGKPSVFGVHLVSEAERLAYADRNKYIADTDFVPLPGGSPDTLLNKPYLRSRAGLVSFTRSMGTAVAGNLGPIPMGVDRTPESGTTHMTIVDRDGNVVVMTTTVESTLGAFHMTQGFILNNQLTDFSDTPTDAAGDLIANRLAPGKRPRSSMSPTLVFKMAGDGSRGEFLMGTGSPGGSTIIQYVAKTLVGVLDWGLDAQQATSLVDFGAANSATTSVGGEHPNVDATNNGANDSLVTGLRALGHTVSVVAQSSGIGTVIRGQFKGTATLSGGADPRREGIALGDLVAP